MRRLVPAVFAVLVLGLSACGGGYDTKTVKADEEESGGSFGFSDAPPRTKVGKEGPRELSPGDVLAFSSRLKQGGKPAGELSATCAITQPGSFRVAKAQCQGTATLPDGELVLNVSGKFASGTTRGAIVGGTGDYIGAGGTFTSVEAGGGSKDTFEIRIPKK
ncbi:MAG TPA: hypothetical protein VJT75_11225 [Thermoleophilaceae bacterium]|nr:hypothetical protein [Thermoleophilaceae bacterium]